MIVCILDNWIFVFFLEILKIFCKVDLKVVSFVVCIIEILFFNCFCKAGKVLIW